MIQSLSNFGGWRRGSVIVLVLAMIVLAGFLLSQFIERAMTEMLVESRARQADRLRVDAHSALEASLAVLADFQAVDGALRSPAQGWGDPFQALEVATREGVTVEARVEDESDRLSLPRLGPEELFELGRELGLKDDQARSLAEALLAWTRRDQVTTRFETDPRRYEYEEPPHRAPGRSIASFGELAAIAVARDLFYDRDGRPTELLASFAERVSLQSFPTINLNTAGPETLELVGLDAAQVGRISDYRRPGAKRTRGQPEYFNSVEEAASLLGISIPRDRFDARARCLRVLVTVREGATTLHLTAVVALAMDVADHLGDATGRTPGPIDLQYPFKLLALEERIELVPTATL